MVTARTRWRDARNRWATDAGLTFREGMELVPGRRPYWSTPDEPGRRGMSGCGPPSPGVDRSYDGLEG